MMVTKSQLRKIVFEFLRTRNEEKKILGLISSLKLKPEQKLLDIGCGHGEKLRMIHQLGIQAMGIDINPILVQDLREAGLPCMTIDEFNQTNELYDVLLMSHIIEHFPPEQLLKFMENYLDRLKPDGYLIIATPLESPYFHDAFDHVKPYHPAAIDMVFGGTRTQVQYYAKTLLELKDIWFRKSPFGLIFFPGLYVRKYSKLPILINLICVLLFHLSFGVIGRTDGWVGLYKKKLP